MSRSLRSLSVLARPSNYLRPLTRSTHSLLRHNGEVNIQQVRFKKPFARRAKRLGYQLVIVAVVLYQTFGYFFEIEETADQARAHTKAQEEARDEAIDGAQEEEVEEDDVQVPEVPPEDAVFIPLGMVREIPYTYYKGSDPEWQSFIEFRQDHERSAAIQKELVEQIYSFYTGTTSVQGKIGVGVPVKLGRIWLDILIPHGPSTEYERSGLEITRDYIAWTTRPIPALEVARLHSALWPLPVANSLWASCCTYCSLQLAKLKKLFNIAPSSPDTSSQLPVGAITIDQLRENSPSKETQNRAQMDKMPDPKPDVASTKRLAKSAPLDGSKIHGALPTLPLPHSDIGTAVTEFKQTMAKQWQIPNTFGERGTIVVTGDIELIGPRGSCVLSVVADYHPREAKYRNVRMDFKYILPKRQRPVPPKKKDSNI